MRPLSLLAAAAVLALGAAAAAASPAIDGGYCLPPRPGDPWIEVWAEIENTDGEEFRGTLEAVLKTRTETGPSARRDVAVAPGSRKRFFLVMANTAGWRMELLLRLVDGKGKEAASKQVAGGWLQGPERTLAVVSRAEQPVTMFAFLAARKLRGGYAAWEAQEAHLPEHAEGWSAAGLVAIGGADLGAWSAEQRRSLRAWVEMGGQVLLLPGTDRKWLESSGVKELIDLGQVSEEDADQFPSRYFGKSGPRAVLSFGRPGEDLLPAAGNLVKTWRVGSGRVAALTFDANAPAIRNESGALGMAAFAENVLDVMAPPPTPWDLYNDSHGTWYWRGFVEALGQGLVRYPTTALLLLALFAYVVAIGPANFWLLRKRHAPALTVVTVPAAAVVVSVLLLAAGWIGRDRTVRVNRVTIARPDGGGWLAREHVVALSARRQEALLASPLGRLAPMTDGRNEAPMDSAYGGADGAPVRRALQPNEPAYFAAVGRRDLGTISAVASGDLSIVNGSRLDIERAFYYEAGARIADLGPIPSGGSYRGSLLFPRRPTPFTDYGDDSPDALLLRALDPQFMLTTETAVIAIVKGGGDVPLVNGAPAETVRDVTVLIIPVERLVK